MAFFGSLALALVVFAFPYISHGYQEDQPLSDQNKEKIALSIMEKVRCLICKGQTVRDSEAKVAKSLRILIRERVDHGATEEEIRGEITGLYSEWVYTDPEFNSSTLVLWIAPFLGLVLILLFILRRRFATNTNHRI